MPAARRWTRRSQIERSCSIAPHWSERNRVVVEADLERHGGRGGGARQLEVLHLFTAAIGNPVQVDRTAIPRIHVGRRHALDRQPQLLNVVELDRSLQSN